jgi:hypothetical protein
MAALAVWGLVAVQLVAVHPVVTVAAVHRVAAALHPVVVHPVAGNDPLPQDGLASKTGIREATFIPSKSDFLVPMSQLCPRSFLIGENHTSCQ